MVTSPLVLLLLIACAAAGVGAFLYTLSIKIAWEIRVHELRVETHRLRIEQDKRMAALRAKELGAPETDIQVKVIGTPSGPERPEATEEQRKAA